MRTWTRLVPAVLLVLPLTPALLRAADSDNTSLAEKLNQISKKGETLDKDVKANSLRGNRVEADLRDIREELGKIRELLERMALQQGAIQRQAGYSPSSVSPSIPGGSIPVSGTITLHNLYSAPATIHINGQSYFVEPNRIRTIPNFPVGPFQYSVDVEGYGTIKPPRTASLPPAGYRIRIYPRLSF